MDGDPSYSLSSADCKLS